MELGEFSEILKKEANQIGIVLQKTQCDMFYRYMKLLCEWNEKMNLTAITEPNDIILKHFVDSITINKYLESAKNIIDIGTGAGFPGIPVKILNADVYITLADSLNKRVSFLKEVINQLDIKNVNAIHGRAEEMAQDGNYREAYDVAVSRAVAPLNILLEYMLPFVKVGGFCVCMKGANIEEEIATSNNAINILGGELEVIDKFELPNSNMLRNIIIIRKVKTTDRQYPRKAGVPTKQPL